MSTLREAGQEVFLGIVGVGGVTRLAEAFTGQPSLCTAMSMTETRAYSVNSPLLRRLAARDITIAAEIQAQLAREVVSVTLRCEQFAGSSAEERLLWFIREFHGNGLATPYKPIALPFSLTELVLFIGITPSYLSRLLNRLDEDGRYNVRSVLWSALRRRHVRLDGPREPAG